MNEHIRQIADRVRGLREIARLSVETCAKDVGIPVATYRKYESGEMDIPVSFLYQIAHKFQVDLSSILTGEEPRLRIYSVTRAGRGVKVERRKDYDYQSLGFNFLDKRMEPFLVSVAPLPDGASGSLNAHPGQEFEYVLQGTLKVTVGGHEVVLAAGDSILFDSSHPHGVMAVGGPTTFIAVIA
jgi:mannose-6-phosphate isomerase-like protein (cupin superfamily)